MKYIKANIQGKPKEINLVLMNDLHFGSEAVDYGLLERVFDFIASNRENTRILINGDLIEGVTKNSKGDIYTQRMTPEEQLEFAVETFKPYKDLIDGVTKGNHDYRIEDEVSIDIVKWFCKELDILDKYMEFEGVVGYAWNKCFYSVEMFHGTGGGGTIGSVERNMTKMRKTTADVFYCGHWHKEFAKPFKEYNLDPYNKCVREVKKWLICGNTIVQTAEYAKKFRYQESFPSQAVVTLRGEQKKRDIKVDWIR
ncbi:metallophosphoesterase [Metabacillus sp. Hm71]|uniref:metallophosphoesterase n=1 Tax=Metabacillus sp. Hm71 TaxID=3450743 RepID=UPI003F435DD6